MAEKIKFDKVIVAKWLDDTKTKAGFKVEMADGSSTQLVSIAGDENWEDLIAVYPIEEITATTERMAKEDRLELQRKQEERLIKEEEEQKAVALQKVFNLKLQAFDIDMIQKCDNRELRSNLRKAQTPIEVFAWTTMIIMEEYNKTKLAEKST